MVTYEVTAIVSQELVAAYEAYMRRHIPDLLATGHFASAIFERGNGRRYRTRYHARDQDSLDRYLAEDAPRLRADFAAHFPGGIEVTRETWSTLEEWPPN